jgi:hypothetical protein
MRFSGFDRVRAAALEYGTVATYLLCVILAPLSTWWGLVLRAEEELRRSASTPRAQMPVSVLVLISG